MANETLKELKYNNSKVLVEAAKRDGDGKVIATTYATEVDVNNNFVKKTYSYTDKTFTITPTNVVTSLQYKDGSGNSLSGIYIGNTGVQFLAPSVFQVYYESSGTAYDILTTHNMVAITETEINAICQ